MHRLPDDADSTAIAEEMAFLAALDQGEQDIEAGRIVSNETAKMMLESRKIAYRIDSSAKTVYVVRIWHAAQDETERPGGPFSFA